MITSCSSSTVNLQRMRLEQLLDSDSETQEELKVKLPFLAEALHENKDWFLLLQRYSSEGPRLNIKFTSKSESAVISCVLLLFWDVPPHVKEAAACLLTSISFGTSEAPNVFNQESVEALVLRVLCCDGGATVEVQRQVCLAICFLACRYGMYYAPDVRFGSGIQYRLIELIRTSWCSSEFTFPLISAIANIAMYSEGMRMKILEAQISHSWLGKIMDTCTKNDESILKDACLAVACIASAARKKGLVCDKLWYDIKVHFVPAIVNKCCVYTKNRLLDAAMLAISKICKCVANSPERIRDLVSGGCLKALFYKFARYQDVVMNYRCVAIKTILRAGDVVDVQEGRRRRRLPKHNEYAKMIDEFDPGWDLLLLDEEWHRFNTIIKATYILFKYRPHLLQDSGWRVPIIYSDEEDWDVDEDEYEDEDEEDDEDEDEEEEDEDEEDESDEELSGDEEDIESERGLRGCI